MIGHITGKEINQVQSAMTDYLKENNIAEKKILIVHMFRKSMVKDKESVKAYDNIDLIMNHSELEVTEGINEEDLNIHVPPYRNHHLFLYPSWTIFQFSL